MNSRRGFLGLPALGVFAADGGGMIPPSFPSQAPELAREVVGVSHGNFGRLKELVERRPTLAEAAWEWGFGDWETALGAASHVGNREIALYLIENGAAPTIFSAAMLGQVEVVRAMVAAQPGIQRQKGPHGIPLLAHARAGGARAKDVIAFLTELGGADERPALAPLSDEEKAVLSGTYGFGAGPSEHLKVSGAKGQFTIFRPEGAARNLFHLGGYAFFPAGAEQVRIQFQMERGKALSLTVDDFDLRVTAKRLD